jgi:hypothetical protein
MITRREILYGSASVAALSLSACAQASLAGFVVDFVLPKAPPYPFLPAAQVNAEADRISNALALFIDAWLDGRGPAEIPDTLLPKGTDPTIRGLRLVREADIRADGQWIVREAHDTIDFDRVGGLYPDPHCSYIVPGQFFLPFGCKAIIEGQFPHARFFSIQVTPPFDPRYYYYGSSFGAPEVPIVDADIDPLPGHVNPFRVGADRTATKRGYRVVLEMTKGYGPEIEPAYRPPHYRARGNRRLGSGIVFQGPMGLPEYKIGHKRGMWDVGALWLRYYAPDRGKGPLGGVPLPKITYETASGRCFYIASDLATKTADFNRMGPVKRTDPAEPEPASAGDRVVWSRELDILHTGLVGVFQATGKIVPKDRAQGRALIKGLTAHGPDVPAPGSWGSSASRVPHISYLSGGGSIDRDQVLVLSGRLPRHPRTIQGTARMTGGQIRYMSITTYAVADFLGGGIIGQPLTSVMDEEMVVDPAGNYLLCYSRAESRPRNATEASGVTWLNWGPVGTANFNLRWLTVDGQWKDRRITPDDAAIPYEKASWFEDRFDPSLVGINGASRIMGPFLPTFHYLSRAAFEALGDRPRRDQLPVWRG